MDKKVFSATHALLAFCFVCSALLSCNSEAQPEPAPPSFYHWKTHFQITPYEHRYLDSLGVEKIFAKFFDVDWDATASVPVPLAMVEMDTTSLVGLEIVPTIFITNRTLINLPMQEVDSLARRILQKISQLATEQPKEIQFDCDWTSQTRDKYFALLDAARRSASASFTFSNHHPPLKISATIRLHQLKYPNETGVPPVDRGMLMCYNMGDLEEWATENSILDSKVAASYLPEASTVNYPLPLDVALPIFRWGVLFRDGEMIKLFNNLSASDLQDSARFLKTAANRYEVVRNTYLYAHYLYAGDQIRLEAADPASVSRMARLLNNKVSVPHKFTIAFYHLDSTDLRFFPKETIMTILDEF